MKGLTMQIESIKEEAYRILDKLPEKATWDDLMYQIYVRQAIEAGIKDSDAGRTMDVKEVRKRFGLLNIPCQGEKCQNMMQKHYGKNAINWDLRCD